MTDSAISTKAEMDKPPTIPPCVVGNFGDDIEDLGERLVSLNQKQLTSLEGYLAQQLDRP